MKSIIIASKNRGKLEEYRKLLSKYDYVIESLFDYPIIDEIDEPYLTFAENALHKANTIHQILQKPVIADDSGIMVNALNGLPGVRSKRFSVSGTDEANNELLLETMKNITHREAKFVAVIAYVDKMGTSHLFFGETEGTILNHPKGSSGFGYDPLFYIESLQKTFAELSVEEKNVISHRAKAFQQLIAYLEDQR